MKPIFKFLILTALILCSSCSKKTADTNPPPVNPSNSFASATEINQRLGRGINLGNTFEGDVSWGQSFDPDYFRIIASLGFKHVRIPIRWERNDRSLSTAPYTIQPSFLTTIKNVVDAALKNKLHIIINMHHHDALTADPVGGRERFLSQWKQIANYFKSYCDSVLFEVLNEPHDKLTTDLWNEYFPLALAEIRNTNPDRTVLLGVADWGGVGSVTKLIAPTDKHLILTIHYYNPFHFTHQGAEWVANSDQWLGTRWYDIKDERNAVENDFAAAIQFAKDKNIPIHIGEFGAYSKADMDSRIRWARFLSRWFEQQGFSWAYWEFNAGFGIYDPVSKQLKPGLADALTRDAMPAAYEPPSTGLYASNFSNGQKDGWDLYNNDASAASVMTINNERVNVTVTQPGNETWHLQLIRHGFNIEKGKMYRVSFNAYSNGTKKIFSAFQQAISPWTLYSNNDGFDITTVDTNYSFVFTATQSDTLANLVLSVGKSGTTSVTLYNIRVSQLII